MNKKSKFLQTLLEINNVSFKYYLGIYLILLVLDVWKEDFIFRTLSFRSSWLMWFVILSGILKFFFNLDKIINWVKNSSFKYSKNLLGFLSFLKGVKDYFCYLFQEFKKSVNSIFSYSLIFYLILLLIEQFKDIKFFQEGLFSETGPVGWFLSGRMNWFLGWVILMGALSVILSKEKQREIVKEEITFKDYIFIFGLGTLGAFLIFYKTKELGWLSYLISAISGLLIILLSIIILREDEDET